jgi:hypothetical protein
VTAGDERASVVLLADPKLQPYIVPKIARRCTCSDSAAGARLWVETLADPAPSQSVVAESP